MQSFNRVKEFENEIKPMMEALIDRCEELGIGIVVGMCIGAEEGHQFLMTGGACLDEGNAACHLVAMNEILGDKEDGHEYAHLVIEQARNKILANSPEFMEEVIKYAEEHKDEIAAAVREAMRRAEQSESAKLN